MKKRNIFARDPTKIHLKKNTEQLLFSVSVFASEVRSSIAELSSPILFSYSKAATSCVVKIQEQLLTFLLFPKVEIKFVLSFCEL